MRDLLIDGIAAFDGLLNLGVADSQTMLMPFLRMHILLCSRAPSSQKAYLVQLLVAEVARRRSLSRPTTCPPGTWLSTREMHYAVRARDFHRAHQAHSGPSRESMTQIVLEASNVPLFTLHQLLSYSTSLQLLMYTQHLPSWSTPHQRLL